MSGLPVRYGKLTTQATGKVMAIKPLHLAFPPPPLRCFLALCFPPRRAHTSMVRVDFDNPRHASIIKSGGPQIVHLRAPKAPRADLNSPITQAYFDAAGPGTVRRSQSQKDAEKNYEERNYLRRKGAKRAQAARCACSVFPTLFSF